MSGFRWTQVFLVLLHWTATTEQLYSFTVRDGDEVTLPCEDVTQLGYRCTSWVFTNLNNGITVELIINGRIEQAEFKDRLSVTEDCSLVLKNITVEDSGLYSCRWIEIERVMLDDNVYLSVIDMSEQKDSEKMTLNCSVWTHGVCYHAVRWLYEGKDTETPQSGCSVTVTLPPSELQQRSKFTCEVTDGYTGRVQQLPFRPQTSGEATTTASVLTAAPPTTPAGCSALDYVMLAMRVAELLLITVITVLIVRAPGNRRPADANTVRQRGGTVTYENVAGPSASVNVHTNIGSAGK